MSLKYFDSYNKFIQKRNEAADNDIQSKFLRRDPDKLIEKGKDSLYSLEFENALRFFSKAFKNATDQDKDQAIDQIMTIVEYFEGEKLPDLDEVKKNEFAGFTETLDLELIESDRKLKSALRKIKHAEQKIDSAQAALAEKNYLKAAENIKDAERKIDKAYSKKIEDSKASEDDKEVVKNKILAVIGKIDLVQTQIKEFVEKLNDQAEKDRVNKKLDKRELDRIADIESSVIDSTPVVNDPVSTDSTEAGAGSVSDNTEQPVAANEPTPESLLTIDNVLQTALDPELHKNPKFKKSLTEQNARRLALILWDCIDDLGTNEDLLFDTLKSPFLDTIADYSYLSDVYRSVSAQKDDDPIQDLYLAIYDTALGFTELTDSERIKVSEIILNKIKGTYATK